MYYCDFFLIYCCCNVKLLYSLKKEIFVSVNFGKYFIYGFNKLIDYIKWLLIL